MVQRIQYSFQYHFVIPTEAGKYPLKLNPNPDFDQLVCRRGQRTC